MIRSKSLVQKTVILQLLVVSVFGGQGWKHIPEIPAGRRAQYLLLKRDGGYKYGYDTAKGSSAFQSATADNEVTGNYAYTGGDGLQQGIQYTSGIGGFVPKISPSQAAGSPAVSKSSVGISQAASQINDESSGDSSYNFAFNAGNFQQEERSDAAHNVVGSYQYTADDGQHNVQYSAAPGTGFLANVDGVQYPGKQADGGSVLKSQGFNYQTTQPVYSSQVTNDLQQGTIAPYFQNQEETTGDSSYTFSYSSDAHSRDETSDSQGNVQGTYSFVDPTGTQQKIDYTAGDKTGFLVKQISSSAASGFSKSAVQHSTAGVEQSFSARKPSSNYLPSPASSDYDESGPSDASYSFSYQAADHSRQESSDASGNVIGSYSFVAKDDGVPRTVDYTAGAERGFVASGAHLPESPSSQSSSTSSLTKTFSSPSQTPQQNYIPTVPNVKSVPVTPVSAPTAPDGSYSFSFDAGDHSRTESGDSSGSVQGSYSFVTKEDGVRRKVDYSASSATGFVANVSPSVQSVPTLPSAITAAPYAPAQTSPPWLSYASSIQATGISSEGTGGSYSFSYDAGDHSRSESGDASGNVKGSYSFTAKDDGLQRKVDYVASSDTGFLASGAHLPTPVPPQAPLTPVAASGFTKTSSFRPQAVPYTPISPLPGSAVQSGVTDGSYSFTYDAGDHSRTESGDASGNVKGRFSFTPKDDGLTRTIDYSAGAETGFIAAGAHLPSAAAIPQTSVQSTYTKSSLPSAPSAGNYQTPVGTEDESSGDASYSYSYETDSSSKQETSDSQGNVAGSFTFLGGDGISRTVQYTSQGDEGFVASGDHLPKPGSPILSPPSHLPQISTGSRTAFGIKGQSAVSSGGYSNYKTNSFNSNSLAHGKSAIEEGNKISDYVIHTYLPPDSEKFGYIFDTKGH